MAVRPHHDFVLADTHPGIGGLTVDVLRRAGATIVVSTPEPTALTDTYALFKVLSQTQMRGPAGLVINQAGSSSEAYETARLFRIRPASSVLTQVRAWATFGTLLMRPPANRMSKLLSVGLIRSS